MGCNCSKKIKIRHFSKENAEVESKESRASSKLSVLKQMWEDAKKQESNKEKTN